MTSPEPSCALVTDSAACLGPLAAGAGIDVLPLRVMVGDDPLPATGAGGPAAVISALAAGERVTTSQPSAASFDAVYRRLASDDATPVISVHLSAGLSGTCQAARAAAGRASGQVEVIDSGTAAMALGFAVLTGALAARAGQDVADVTAAITGALEGGALWLVAGSGEYLRSGGRLGALDTGQGVPVLCLRGGKLAVAELAGDLPHARAAMVAAAAAHARQTGSVVAAVHYAEDPGLASEVLGELEKDAGAALTRGIVCAADAVLAAHTGPQVTAIALAPESPGLSGLLA